MAYDVARIQKRTRDKEYRLRRQGANQESIDAVSPRKSWAEVKAMPYAEQQKYARRLDRWNKTARYTGVEGGNVIPTSLIDQAKRLQQARNHFIAAERERIRNIAPKEWETFYEKQEGILAKGSGIEGLLSPIDIKKMKPPKSVAIAKRRIKRFEKRNKHKFSFYRNIQRENMQRMLWTLGDYELAEVVRHMDKDTFDLLSTIYPSWSTLELMYKPKGETVGDDDPLADFRGYVERAISVTSGKSQVDVQKHLKRYAKRRTERGMFRAQIFTETGEM